MSLPSGFPIHFRTLCGAPEGLVCPEVTPAEMLRVMSGGYAGLRLAGSASATWESEVIQDLSDECCDKTSTASVSLTGGPATATRDYPRSAPTRCAVLCCGEGGPQFPLRTTGALTPGAGVITQTVIYDLQSEELPEEEQAPWCGEGEPEFPTCAEPYTDTDETEPVMILEMEIHQLGFYRLPENKIGLVFHASIRVRGTEADPELHVYAPVSGSTDSETFYGLPAAPAEDLNVGQRIFYTEINPAAGSLFGVTLESYGWTESQDNAGLPHSYESSEHSGTITPGLAISEL